MCSLWLKVLNCDACKSIRSKSVVYTVRGTRYDFLLRVGCFWSCSCSQKKNEILDEGRDALYAQVFAWHFNFLCFIRGHSLVELTEHDDSAADIMVQYST